MFPFNGPPVDDSIIRPLGDDDQRVLLGLVHRYGLNSLMCALTGLGESSRASAVSATTLFSSTSAPSLVWTASDGASIRTASTRDGPLGQDMAGIHDPEMTSKDHTWLESPCAIQSPSIGTTVASPHLPIATLKKYQCPMCFLDRNLVEFGRKSDFKKHLNNFHGTDVVWICRTKGCHLSFATERAYSTHAKEAHKMEALPSSAARTELCPQLVFSCGFGSCKDRVFEATNRDDAPASRDKYFEHIAKHFEDDFDVNDWEYKVQMHNLMHQQRVKSIWKTCIWPKERRTQLTWKPRSSGDLRRMLEARHLGEDISQLVRLAYVLGTAPFTSSRTPPPAEIDMHFQLPFRSQCLLEDASAAARSGSDDSSTPTISLSKSRPNSIFRLPSRKGKQSRTRPTTPASSNGHVPSIPQPDVPMISADATSGPHPGTPMPIPSDSSLPSDAPKFAPEAGAHLPRQLHTPPVGTPMSDSMHGTPMADSPAVYSMHMGQHEEPHYPLYSGPAPTSMPINIDGSYEASVGYQHSETDHDEMAYGCTPTQSIMRPSTPVPHKRPASWSRVTADDMRPAKRPATPHGAYDSPMSMQSHHDIPQSMPMVALDQIPNAYGEMIPPHQHHNSQQPPTSYPQPEWALPMRMGQEPQGGYHHHPAHGFAQAHGMEPMTTFFFDDVERM